MECFMVEFIMVYVFSWADYDLLNFLTLIIFFLWSEKKKDTFYSVIIWGGGDVDINIKCNFIYHSTDQAVAQTLDTVLLISVTSSFLL